MLDSSAPDLIDLSVAHAFNDVVTNATPSMPGRTPAIFHDTARQTRSLDILENSVRENVLATSGGDLRPALTAVEHVRDLVELSQSVEANKYDDKFPELLKPTHFAEAVKTDLRTWSNAHHSRKDDVPHAGSIVYIDIDNFKRINDTYGHDVGDEVIALLARCMRQTMRPDDKLGRMGGEELAIWFTDSSVDALEAAFLKLGDKYGNEEGLFIRINAAFHEGLGQIKAKHKIEWEPTMVYGKPTYFSAGISSISSSEVRAGTEDDLYAQHLQEADLDMYANKNRRKGKMTEEKVISFVRD